MTLLPQRNLLEAESSPYLRQHADNPVHWRPWGVAALGEARALDRPILLSVGYAACHWCHVMAHESFENADVAAVMNRLFVNIKVDREERPDIDQLYMASLTAMGEQGGWPLTIFLTPDARSFWGGTYFPREPRYGRPGFVQVLEAVARTWTERREDLSRSADTLSGHVHTRLAPASSSREITSSEFERHAAAIAGMIDEVKGGLRGAPKFPNAPFMNLLWLSWLNTAETGDRDAVLTSLRGMLAGGIYDHVGGGLCRYSTDADWLVPHFEKMLYDNAQLIELCRLAYAETSEASFRTRIEETVDWLHREMLLPSGAFASSLDADSEGEEGLFYLWTRHEINDVLGGDRAATFLESYALGKPAEWEGDPILHRDASKAEMPPDELAAIRTALLARRDQRIRPGRDDKALVDWNGLVIAALAGAGRQLDRADWIDLAETAFRFVTESQHDGHLPHSILGESRLFPCMATDYAAMINAAVALAEATGDDSYAKQAVAWSTVLDRWYADDAGTGHFLSASDARDIPMRLRGDVDEAVPSATAQIITALQRLSMLASDLSLAERTVVLAENALGRAASQPYGQAGILHAVELVRQPAKLIMVDGPEKEFVTMANQCPDPRRVDLGTGVDGEASMTLPDGTVIDRSKPGAWLCLGMVCLPPLRDPQDLPRHLRGRR